MSLVILLHLKHWPFAFCKAIIIVIELPIRKQRWDTSYWHLHILLLVGSRVWTESISSIFRFLSAKPAPPLCRSTSSGPLLCVESCSRIYGRVPGFVSRKKHHFDRDEPSASAPTNKLLAMSRDSVSTCVASLSSAYNDGAELIQNIKAKRKSRNTFQDASIDASVQELESSLNRGESAVRIQYERTYKRCGDAFAQGDRTFLHHKH